MEEDLEVSNSGVPVGQSVQLLLASHKSDEPEEINENSPRVGSVIGRFLWLRMHIPVSRTTSKL